MSECVFCLIAQKKIQSEIVYEDEDILAFKDIKPEAPVHIIVIPKKHISSVMDLNDENISIVSKAFNAIKSIAEKYNIAKSGFRIVANCGKDGGQSVMHLHFHLLGGRDLKWPPG
ncbi:MAG: histidine triad nucleotide-binding protein [Clostridiales bacterium]|nr:histidine triad nucleotide-binding protein [Clostridiales bacterium]HBM81241.1 histidine triad nucleotide-binding protein [Clostridiaceae bacterium]